MPAVRKRNLRKFSSILVFTCLLFFGISGLNAQIGLSVQKDVILPIPALEATFSDFSPLPLSKHYHQKSVLSPNLSDQPSIYSFEHLALFCKIEVRLEKAVKFPVKFRLGDVPYVDQLEGKGKIRY